MDSRQHYAPVARMAQEETRPPYGFTRRAGNRTRKKLPAGMPANPRCTGNHTPFPHLKKQLEAAREMYQSARKGMKAAPDLDRLKGVAQIEGYAWAWWAEVADQVINSTCDRKGCGKPVNL